MKLKYYLRGAGLGMIVATLILMVSFSVHKTDIPDEEIMQRASQLGMITPDKEDGNLQETEASQQDITDILQGTGSGIPEVTGSDENQTTSTEMHTTQPSESENSSEAGNSPIESQTPGDSQTSAEIQTQAESQQTVASQLPEPQKRVFVKINKGNSCWQIAQKMKNEGLIDSVNDFSAYMKNKGYADNLQVGIYEIPYGATYEEIGKIFMEKNRN